MIKNTSSIYYPPGSVTTCATACAPNGWVICDGGTFDGTDIKYTNLWTVLGTTYGGSNQSSFRVPNLGGRTVAGRKSSFAGTGLDGPVGSWTGSTSTTLTSGQTGVKSHFHGVTDPGHGAAHTITHTMGTHTHTVKYIGVNWDAKNADRAFYEANGGNPSTYPSSYTDVSLSLNQVNSLTSLSVNNNASANASTSHTNTQPSLSLNYIIKL